MRILSRVLLVAALASLGCGSTVVTPGPTPDGGAVCRFPDGTQCRQGQSCPSPDGCNTCSCGADGLLACTLRACVDGGPDVPAQRTCRSTADCTAGEECHITEGCATPSYCGPGLGRPCTGDLAPYCGCDGTTFFASSTCPTRVYARRGPCEAVDGGAPDAGATCQSSGDCPPSTMCQGAMGCGVAWRCVPLTGCTPDLARFCSCDGTTFEGSSSCPGRPYRAFGACPAADGGVACAAMDARGEGDCDGYFGVAWNGADCVGLTGCRCVGADCGRAFRDRAACVAACVR